MGEEYVGRFMGLSEMSGPKTASPKEQPTPKKDATPTEAWFVYSRKSGQVVAVYFREPPSRSFDPWNYGIVKGPVSKKDIASVHDLRTSGGLPRARQGMAGI